MSNKKSIIEVSPSSYSFKEENFDIKGFTCSKCNGNKVFIDQIGHDKFKEKTCSFCKGTGRIKASIKITWNADE